MSEKIKTIFTKDFNLRIELENYVRNTIGLTIGIKPEYVIQGTKQELKKLSLSDKSLFWGIKVEIIDENGEKAIEEKKEKNNTKRGKITKSGINIKN